MKISNDMFDDEHNVHPEPPKNDTEPTEPDDENESDEGDAGLFDRYPWLMKTGIVVGVLILISALVLGMRAVSSHHNSNEPNTAQIISERSSSKSSSRADNSAKKSSAIKHIVGSSSQSATKATSASSTNNSSTASSATNASASSSRQATDAQSVQKRIQSSLPNVKVGATTLVTKGNVDVSSADNNGQVVTTLSSDGHKFATISTKDGADTLSLLPGYQSYVDEHVSTK